VVVRPGKTTFSRVTQGSCSNFQSKNDLFPHSCPLYSRNLLSALGLFSCAADFFSRRKTTFSRNPEVSAHNPVRRLEKRPFPAALNAAHGPAYNSHPSRDLLLTTITWMTPAKRLFPAQFPLPTTASKIFIQNDFFQQSPDLIGSKIVIYK